MNRIGAEAPDANMLLFVDGSAKGESRAGYTILPALTLDGVIAYDIVEGSVTAERFVRFLKDYVMPFTTPYPGPRSVVVMENCRIHHSEEVRELVEDMHLCKLVFLPPSSPNYNPIEQAFSEIKAYLHRHRKDMPLMARVRACQSITPDHAAAYFRASGYTV